MKDYIISALNDAMKSFKDRIPKTKNDIVRSSSISDLTPSGLAEFVKTNNIPDHATVDGVDNGYDAWDDICFSWNIKVPTTNSDKLKYSRRVFTTPAFKQVHSVLTSNGYKRVGFNSGLLSEFDDTTVYDMYVDKDFDRLVKYYSLSFQIDLSKLVDGVDYHGQNDLDLIKKYGYNNLNFVPSTPPNCR